jgi:hypothetical protein
MRCAAYGGLAYEKPQSGLRPFTTGTSVQFFSGRFASPGLCYAKPLFGLAKRRIQPERYVQFARTPFYVIALFIIFISFA